MRHLLLALAACAPSPALRLESTDLYGAGEAPRFVLADVNGDGVSDLVTSFDGPLDRGVTVRRGALDGRFGDAQRVLVGSITLAPFDVGADGASDLVVGDGQHVGVLREGHGPFRVLGPSREAVLGANADGVLTTDGRDLVLHAWDVPIAKPLEIAPLVPTAFADVDGDGRGDVIGMALGHAAIRLGAADAFGPVHLLHEADGLSVADVDGNGTADVVTWSHGQAFAWNGAGRPIRAFTVPDSLVGVAAGDLDGDGSPEIVHATRDQVEILGGPVLERLWRNVRQLAVDRGRIVVADDGFIAVVRPPTLSGAKAPR